MESAVTFYVFIIIIIIHLFINFIFCILGPFLSLLVAK